MATLDNYTMYSKDRSGSGLLVAVKVQGNAGLEIDNAVRKDLVNMRTFHMEYDFCSKKGKLPACFSRVFGLEVAPFVMLRDPKQNEIEVAVEKKDGKVYFTEGWDVLQRFYRIFSAAWITIVYANGHLFLFELRSMHGEELVYPEFNPPQKLMLQSQSAYEYRNSFIHYGVAAHFLPRNFCHVMVKELTHADVTSGMLKLGWIGFCQAALPAQRTELTLVDYLGYTWKLYMDFCREEGVSCVFTGQWQALVDARRLTKGTTIKLGVTGSTNNRVVYLCPPPMVILRTKVLPSAAAAPGAATYRVLEYFWRN